MLNMLEDVLFALLYLSVGAGLLFPLILLMAKIVSWRTSALDDFLELAVPWIFFCSFYGFIAASTILAVERLVRLLLAS